MEKLNIEIKAKIKSLDEARKIVKILKAKKIGVYHQKDTYFKVGKGRLKLREVKGLNPQLIYYERKNISKPKKSNLLIMDVENPKILKKILGKIFGVWVVVEKVREVYMFKGVKIHLDKVKMVISTIPNHRDTMLMIKKIREHNHSAKIIVTAYMVEEALSLYDEGADYVILPHLLGGEHAGVFLETVSTDLDKLIETKLAHINELKKHHSNIKHKRSGMHPNHKN